MEDDDCAPAEANVYYLSRRFLSPEIIGIIEDTKSTITRNPDEKFSPQDIEIVDEDSENGILRKEEEKLLPVVVDIAEDKKNVISKREEKLATENLEIIFEENTSSVAGVSKDEGVNNINAIYVAVGKDDIDVVKWALENAVSPGDRIFLIHVYPPINMIPTPIGKFPRSQLTPEQVRIYIDEENNKRKHLLQKYIDLCADAQVTIEVLPLENDSVEKAILELVPVHNITNLVIGTKKPPLPDRRLGNKIEMEKFLKENIPDYCKVTVIHNGKKVVYRQYISDSTVLSSPKRSKPKRQTERSLFSCGCFTCFEGLPGEGVKEKRDYV